MWYILPLQRQSKLRNKTHTVPTRLILILNNVSFTPEVLENNCNILI
jgi:hypothetical protein